MVSTWEGAGGELVPDRCHQRPADADGHAIRVVDLDPLVVAFGGDLPGRQVGGGEGVVVEVVDQASALVGGELAQPGPALDLVHHLEVDVSPLRLAVDAQDRR